MPEHVHLLVCPTEPEYDMAAFCGSIKVAVGRRAVCWVKEHAPDFLTKMADAQPNGVVHHRFWQRGGGHDRNVTQPRTLLNQIDYIHANPVRRGLCERPTDWFWSSAPDYAGRIDGPLPLDLKSLPETPIE
jgi:putative transposase